MNSLLKCGAFHVLLGICLVLSVRAQDAPATLAVIDFNAPDLTSSAVVTLSNVVRKEILKLGSFTVVDRNNMETILKEQGFQKSGACNDVMCLVQAGEILGVQKMVGGNIGKLGNKFVIDLQIIDVQNGKIEKMESDEYVGPLEELDGSVRNLTLRLIGSDKAETGGTRLHVASQPEGARVFIDDVFRGNAPLTCDAVAGKSVLVRTELPGYSSWQQSVRAKADQTSFINAVMTCGTGAVAAGNDNEYERRKKSPGGAFLMSFLLPPVGHFYVGKTASVVRGLLWTGCLTFFALNIEQETETIAASNTWPYSTHTEKTTEINNTYAQAFMICWIASAVDAMASAKLYNKELQRKYGVSMKSDPTLRGRNVQLALQYRW